MNPVPAVSEVEPACGPYVVLTISAIALLTRAIVVSNMEHNDHHITLAQT